MRTHVAQTSDDRISNSTAPFEQRRVQPGQARALPRRVRRGNRAHDLSRGPPAPWMTCQIPSWTRSVSPGSTWWTSDAARAPPGVITVASTASASLLRDTTASSTLSCSMIFLLDVRGYHLGKCDDRQARGDRISGPVFPRATVKTSTLHHIRRFDSPARTVLGVYSLYRVGSPASRWSFDAGVAGGGRGGATGVG